MINIVDRQAEERITPVLRLGFRPFFLLATSYSVLVILIWLFAFQYGQPASLQVPALWWHVHEMFFGFGIAIVAGFLLTAVQTWTGVKGTSSWKLGVIVGLWSAPRLLLWTSVPLLVIAIIDGLFLLAVAWEVGSRVVIAKRWRNLFFAPMLLVAMIANLASYATVKGIPPFPAIALWQAMLWWFVLLISIMGSRVIPFFTARKFGHETPKPMIWLEWLANLPLLLLAILSFFPIAADSIAPPLMLLAGAAQLFRLYRWKGLKAFSEPLVWSLHLFYLFIPVVLILKALSANAWHSHTMLHLLAIGGFAGVILAMIARVTMGHTGHEIYKGPLFWPAFVLLAASALIRVFGVILFPQYLYVWLWVSGAGWILSFAGFVWNFGPMLMKARVDGHPG